MTKTLYSRVIDIITQVRDLYRCFFLLLMFFCAVRTLWKASTNPPFFGVILPYFGVRIPGFAAPTRLWTAPEEADMFLRRQKTSPLPNHAPEPVGKGLPPTPENIGALLGRSGDYVRRNITVGSVRASLIFLDGMVSSALIDDHVLRPLAESPALRECRHPGELLDLLEGGEATFSEVNRRTELPDVLSDILTGGAVLTFSRGSEAMTFRAKGFATRSITPAADEDSIKASKEAFIESLRTNTSMVRRKLASPYLVLEDMPVGRQSRTLVTVAHLSNITDRRLVDAVKSRLQAIDTDGLLVSGFVEEALTGSTANPFPQFMHTERPDKFCIGLLQGAVGILINGLPIAYLTPMVFHNFFRDPEDYAHHYLFGTFLRLLRYTMFFISLTMPAVFIAITCFHQEMVPIQLALAIQTAREGVPLPGPAEMLILLIAGEVLTQAGLRLPKSIGQTVSIIGGLVIGEAAVSAKFLSPGGLVVAAIAIICSYTMLNQDFSNALRIWRFLLALGACAAGLYGVIFAGIWMLFSLADLECMGVPYLSPEPARRPEGIPPTGIRPPLSRLTRRPPWLGTLNRRKTHSPQEDPT